MICGLLVQRPQSVSRSLLPANLPLFSRHLQLPIPIGVDLPLAPGEHVLWAGSGEENPKRHCVFAGPLLRRLDVQPVAGEFPLHPREWKNKPAK